ncbi:calcium-binding protein [Phytobacter sp. V91]|uniref:calcium-binding protein n=1 Tax=Phytobacter sp. V91 TaxID=3369425 RepID=UPI003F5EB6A7
MGKYSVTLSFADGSCLEDKIFKNLPLRFDDGDQWYFSNNESSVVYAGGGNDVISGNWGNDILYGEDGDDTLEGSNGDDLLVGGTGNDWLDGGMGNDSWLFSIGDGQDTLYDFYGEHDTLRFAAGILAAQTQLSRSGKDLVMTFQHGDDSVTISDYFASACYQVEQIVFADGTIWDVETVYAMLPEPPDEALPVNNQQLYGSEGDDILIGGEGDDVLAGGVGDDVLDGGAGADRYLFNIGDGNDVIRQYDFNEGNDILQIGEGITADNLVLQRNRNDLNINMPDSGDSMTISGYFIRGGLSIKHIVFADNTTWDFATIQAKVLMPTDDAQQLYSSGEGYEIHAAGGDDTLTGSGTNDVLFGEAGNDSLDGGAGDDLLAGGIGNDSLSGSRGNDTYLFNAGDGQDIITEYRYGATDKRDTLRLGEGLDAGQVILQCDADNLVIRFQDSSDSITIKNYFFDASYRIDQIVFADGTCWDNQRIRDILVASTEHADTIKGLRGGSEIHGGDGADTLEGGIENDLLYGDAGDDIINGGIGNDLIHGGRGNDTLNGGFDSDTYLFNAGDGQDTIIDGKKGSSDVDTLRFGEGILAGQTIARRSNGDLLIRFADTADSVTVKDFFPTYHIGQIVFADGTTWDVARVQALVLAATDADQYLQAFGEGSEIHGGDGNDTLQGGVGNDALSGDDGDDLLYCDGGDDTLYGGTGNDKLYGSTGVDLLAGGAGDDTLDGGVGDDILHGEDGNDNLYGSSGNDWLAGGAGNDYLSGGDGDDLLAGGTGNDSLYGNGGSDSYRFNAGDGQDVLSDYGNSGETDSLCFGDGILASQAVITRSGNNLVIGFQDSTDSVTVQNFFWSSRYQVEHISFADGTDWLVDDILNHLQYDIPLPMASSTETPYSINLLNQEISQFLAERSDDDAGTDFIAIPLATTRTTAVAVSILRQSRRL